MNAKTRPFYNAQTGEIIYATTRHDAIKYFKADGKRCGYTVSRKDIRLYEEMKLKG